MSDAQLQRTKSIAKIVLAFVNAFAAVLAGYPGPDLSPIYRLLCVATVAGCGAALLMLDPPGKTTRQEVTVTAVTDELEKRARARGRSERLRAVNRD